MWRGLLRHDARDVERGLGIEVAHTNTMIDPTITAMNVSEIYDPDTGDMKPMRSVDDALDVLDQARRITELSDHEGRRRSLLLFERTRIAALSLSSNWILSTRATRLFLLMSIT